MMQAEERGLLPSTDLADAPYGSSVAPEPSSRGHGQTGAVIVPRIASGAAASGDEATDDGTNEADEDACEAKTGPQAVYRHHASRPSRPTTDGPQEGFPFAVSHDRRIAGDLE